MNTHLDACSLDELGWNESLDASFPQEERIRGAIAARVLTLHRNQTMLASTKGFLLGLPTHRLVQELDQQGTSLAVGDWLVVRPRDNEPKAIMLSLLPRFSQLTRADTRRSTHPQVIAANVDVLFIVCAMNGDFNLRRIERYLAVAWESGARPVVALNKADLAANVVGMRLQVESLAPDIPVVTVSATTGQNLSDLEVFLQPGHTAAFVGMSGAGKSTLINTLLGAPLQSTQELMARDRGKHTTTRRELLRLPSGALVIDTPGMRLLGIPDDSSAISQVFEDLEQLATRCRFRNCRHLEEPDCAIQRAIAEGALDPKRVRNWLGLGAERCWARKRSKEKSDSKAQARPERWRWKQARKEVHTDHD